MNVILLLYVLTGILFAYHSYKSDRRILIALAAIPLWWLVICAMMLAAIIQD